MHRNLQIPSTCAGGRRRGEREKSGTTEGEEGRKEWGREGWKEGGRKGRKEKRPEVVGREWKKEMRDKARRGRANE